jgi:hypothetical protein
MDGTSAHLDSSRKETDGAAAFSGVIVLVTTIVYRFFNEEIDSVSPSLDTELGHVTYFG